MTDGAAPVRLTDEQRFSWLRLFRCENVGPITFRELVNHFGSAAAALEALPSLSRRGGAVRQIRIPSAAVVEAEIAAVERHGARLVALGEPDYPRQLVHADGAPPVLTIKGGSPALLARPAVAIVGSRNASVAGARIAAQIAIDLGAADYVIVSGLARGIDTASHRASVAGGTIAVVAGGIDHIYPDENAPLHAAILAAGGAVISEMPFGWSPRAQDFPRRNRIISGIADGVVVIEAAEKSGSLHTARFALDQGREVFAVPGSPLDPRSAGTNRLIREGATLTRSGEDVLEGLAALGARRIPLRSTVEEPIRDGDDEADRTSGADVADRERAAIIEALGPTPVSVDEVIRHTGLSPAKVQLVIMELALAGRLERHGRQLVSLL